MSLRKLLLVAAVSAIAAMAIGAGSASASVFCFNPEGPCTGATTVPAGHVLTGASVGTPTLTGTLAVTCASSATRQVVTSMTTVDVQSLTFSSCHITGSSSTCTVSSSAKTGHSVFATTTVSGVTATVTCLGIPCTFSGAGAGESVTGSNIATSNRIAFTNVPLNASGGFFCGTSGQETVTYAFTDDSSTPVGRQVFITSS